MKGKDLIKWIVDNHAEESEVLVPWVMGSPKTWVHGHIQTKLSKVKNVYNKYGTKPLRYIGTEPQEDPEDVILIEGVGITY